MAAGFALAFLLALRFSDLRGSQLPRLVLLLMVPLLLVFTFTSGLSDYTFGALMPYAVMSVMFCATIPDAERLDGIFAAVSVINLILCAGIVLGIPLITGFIESYYSAFYDELVPAMIALHKPVATFATHSLAGLFLYLFFWLNLRTYRARHSALHLALAIAYLVMLAALLSVTGFILLAIGALQMMACLRPQPRSLVLAGSITTIACLGFVLLQPKLGSAKSAISNGQDVILAVAASTDNGFLGRWSSTGVLSGDLHYFSEHPFSPVGVAHRSEFNFADSGIIEHLVRGSIPLLLLVYGGLAYFLWKNLHSKRDAIVLFGILVAFEVGFSGLTYFRTLLTLPFVVSYLNTLFTASCTEPQHSR